MRKINLLILALFLLFAAGTSNFAQNKGEVADKAGKINPILVGQKVPDVTIEDFDGNKVNLREAVAKKPTVLIVYRGGWCPYCNSHLADLKDVEQEILDNGYQILALSMDKPEKLRATLDKHEMNYTLLSDNEAEAVTKMGLAFKVHDKMFNKLKSNGMNLEEYSGKEHHILPAPAAFVIGTDGTVKFSYVNPNYDVRIKPELLVKAVEVYK